MMKAVIPAASMIKFGNHMEIKGLKLLRIPSVCPAKSISQYSTETISPRPKPTDFPLLLEKSPAGNANITKKRQAEGSENFLLNSSL